jgi:hypothetical protein
MEPMFNGKPLSDVMREIENGQFMADVTEALYNIVAAVKETHKTGKLKIVLEIKPTGKETVGVSAQYQAVEPEHGRPITTFFIGRDLSLQRQDPNQPQLPLRSVEVPADSQPIRDVGI